MKYVLIIHEVVLIIHEVEDYEAWKKVFDDATDIRKQVREIAYQVLKYENNPNKIVHFSSWTSIEDAKRFFESHKLPKFSFIKYQTSTGKIFVIIDWNLPNFN
jgi:hypothetical protein